MHFINSRPRIEISLNTHNSIKYDKPILQMRFQIKHVWEIWSPSQEVRKPGCNWNLIPKPVVSAQNHSLPNMRLHLALLTLIFPLWPSTIWKLLKLHLVQFWKEEHTSPDTPKTHCPGKSQTAISRLFYTNIPEDKKKKK